MNYEYVNVDPKVINMLGGDQSPINESFDGDIISSEFSDNLDLTNQMNLQPKMKVVTPKEDVLEQILAELREIKVILAGK